MGWLIAAGVIFLLAIMPLGISAVYDDAGPLLKAIVGPIRIKLYPSKGKKKEKEPKPKTEKKKKASSPTPSAQKKKGGSFQDFLPLVQAVIEFLRTFRRKLRVKRLEMKLIMAADDPCDLAVNYGKAWAAVGNLMPQLERLFVIKKRNVEVECDFTADKTLIFVKLDLTITLGRLIVLAMVHGIRILRQFLTIMKTRKGGAKL